MLPFFYSLLKSEIETIIKMIIYMIVQLTSDKGLTVIQAMSLKEECESYALGASMM